MTDGYDPVLHALFVEPRCARPGETVRVEFRTRNVGALASPAATVAFMLPDGLDAPDGAEVDVDPVAPGAEVTATILARVRAPAEDRSVLPLHAVVRLPDGELATNRCELLVRSHAVFDGAASGTFVEPLDAHTLRVRAEVTNEGDGPAHGVRVVVPAPVGCVRIDGDGPATLEAPRLDVGQRLAFAFDVRIAEPVAEIRADDGEVRFGDGITCAVPARGAFAPQAAIAPPSVALVASRRHVEAEIEVRNDGWIDAREVCVRAMLPKGLKIVEDGVLVDGVPPARRRGRKDEAAFARLERSGNGCTVVVGLIPARARVQLLLRASYPAGWGGGTIGVCAGEHVVETEFRPQHVRDVRLHVLEVPRTAAPGDTARLVVRIANAGDVVETLRLIATCVRAGFAVAREQSPASGAAAVPVRSLAPGAVAVVAVEVLVDPDVRAGEDVSVSVVASDSSDERRARREVRLVIREPITRSGADFRSPADGRTPDAADDDSDAVRAVLHAPDGAFAGAAIGLRLEVDARKPVDELRVCVPALREGTYVAGSTTIDGHAVLDRCGVSPLEAPGLTLRGVPAGAHLTLAWSWIADPLVHDQTVSVAPSLDAGGRTCSAEPARIRIVAASTFALRPAGLRYHVDACTIASASAGVPAPDAAAAPGRSDVERETFGCAPGDAAPSDFETRVSEAPPDASLPDGSTPSAFSFTLAANGERLGEIERFLRGSCGSGMVSHLLLLRAFFPEGVTPAEPALAAALGAVRSALCDAFDRLFVKLRIPGFYVAADDLEDPFLRSAIVALFEQLGERAPGGVSLPALSDVPYGAPCVLRALVSVLPRSVGDARLSAAVSRFAAALDDALARYEGVPLELFEDALARGADRALDDARAALLDALRACAAFAEAVC